MSVTSTVLQHNLHRMQRIDNEIMRHIQSTTCYRWVQSVRSIDPFLLAMFQTILNFFSQSYEKELRDGSGLVNFLLLT